MAAVPVVLVGNVATAPEVKTTPSGTHYVRFRVATNERYRDKEGEWKDHEATFWDVEAWGDVASVIGTDIKVGAPVIVTGPMRSQSWQNEDGEKRVRRFVKVEAIGHDLARRRRGASGDQPAPVEAPADWASES